MKPDVPHTAPGEHGVTSMVRNSRKTDEMREEACHRLVRAINIHRHDSFGRLGRHDAFASCGPSSSLSITAWPDISTPSPYNGL
jgi:hypothetical protein